MSDSKSYFVRRASGLVRQISTLDAMSVALSGMGLLFVYNVTALTPAFYPEANPISVMGIGLLVILPFALMYTLMAIGIPRTGGDYVWVSRIIHPSVGFVTNLTITVLSVSIMGTVTPQAVQWSFAQAFYDFGKLYGNQQYLSIAALLQGQDAGFWASVVIIIISALIVIPSVKAATRSIVIWTLISFVIGAIFVVTILASGVSTFTSNFNSLSGANYDQVIKAGQAAGAYSGVPDALSFPSLYCGFLYLIGYMGFFYPAYFAGEVKDIRKGQIIGQIGAVLVYAVFYMIIVAAMYFGMGPSFANAMGTLWGTGSSQYPYVGPPLTSGLSMFWTQNPILVAIFTLSYGINILVVNISIFFTFPRNLFAWSFDRVMPDKFADVNSRTHTPLNATAVITVLALFFAYIAIYQFGIVAAAYSYFTAGVMIAFAVVSISAVIFPYRRKDLFEASHPIARAKVAGVPIISLVGVISLVECAVAVYAVLQPAILNLGTVMVEGIIPTWVAGIILYAISWAIRKRQGIDLGFAMKEVPPL